jgi:small subunit ribosomal protein S9
MTQTTAKKEYNWGTGRRKEATARVRVINGAGRILVNKREVKEYLKRDVLVNVALEPVRLVRLEGQIDIFANIAGGGLSGQAGALRHGISRALIEFDPSLRPALKRAGFLTRDAREVERKKYGLRGARRRFQFSKR